MTSFPFPPFRPPTEDEAAAMATAQHMAALAPHFGTRDQHGLIIDDAERAAIVYAGRFATCSLRGQPPEPQISLALRAAMQLRAGDHVAAQASLIEVLAAANVTARDHYPAPVAYRGLYETTRVVMALVELLRLADGPFDDAAVSEKAGQP